MILMDDRTEGKIPAWFWGQITTQWFPFLEEDGLYEFSGGMVESLGDFSTTKMKHKLTFVEEKSIVIRPGPEAFTIPRMEELLITDFSQLSAEVVGARVAIKGCITHVSSCFPLESKRMRSAYIRDTNAREVQLMLWDTQVDELTPEMKGRIICVFEASVRNRGRLHLSGNAFMTVKLIE
jgi:hypothetical protein